MCTLAILGTHFEIRPHEKKIMNLFQGMKLAFTETLIKTNT
jgi:hypothetical protein